MPKESHFSERMVAKEKEKAEGDFAMCRDWGFLAVQLYSRPEAERSVIIGFWPSAWRLIDCRPERMSGWWHRANLESLLAEI